MVPSHQGHQQVIDFANGFITIVENATSDDLGRAITSRQLLHIDFGKLHGLWRDLCAWLTTRNTPIIAALVQIIASFISFFLG
jgi:hypothetical protein